MPLRPGDGAAGNASGDARVTAWCGAGTAMSWGHRQTGCVGRIVWYG